MPHSLLAFGPISNSKSPPSDKSLWLNQGWFKVTPLSLALWIYLFSSEALLARISKVLPLPKFTFTLVNIGLPMLYVGEPGVTG